MSGGDALDRSTVARGGSEDAAAAGIDGEGIHESLDIESGCVGTEASEDDFAFVRFAVAIAVAAEPEVGTGRHVDSVGHGEDRGDPCEAVGEDRAALESPVAIAVVQAAHAGELLIPSFRVIPHFRGVESSVRGERQRNRIDHLRFRGREGDPVTGGDPEGGEGGVRGKRGKPGEFG